ncbi:MAG: PKD domain-containing protein [Bacteroidetes bacterium]|nr:PKD domain-containing protein [Bacteroidota bacterium]
MISIPDPANDQQYFLLHINADNAYTPLEYTLYGSHLFYSKIDMAQNGGLGKMVGKNQVVIADSLTAGALTAVRHANGRDWWVLVFKFWSKKYYRVLVSDNGVEVLDQQQIDVPIQKGQFGQFVFSPDGNKFAVASTAWDQQQRHWIETFDFDRCSGLLSNRKRVYCSKRFDYNGILTSDHAQGLAFSPNSRFLYLYFFKKAYQVDTWASNPQQTLALLGNYDGFTIDAPPDIYTHSYFGLAQLAPDGRIYTNTTQQTPYFHTTEQPNNQGLGAKFTQHSFELEGYNLGHIPNHPNYRLGPLEGGGCDTLDIEKAVYILAHPYLANGCIGGSAHFETTAFGTGLSYQWQSSTDAGITWSNLVNDGNFSGAQTEYLTLNNIPTGFDGRQFRCTVSGNVSTEISRPATLTVISGMPSAAFDAIQDKDSLHFQNLAVGYEYFEWNFGDGDSTLLENPSRLYTHAGTYPAILIATNACGSDTFSQDIIIPELQANFHADKTHGCAPLTVNFTSDVPYRVSNQKYLTPGSSIPVAWQNDGTHTVTYNSPGVFDVTLMAFTPQAMEKDTLTKPGYITIETGTNPVANIEASQMGDTVQLGTSFGLADSYTWYFSNGDSLTGQNVSYVFGTPGIYQVVLETANHCGAALDTVQFVVGELEAAFAVGETSGCAPLTVQFENTSAFVADSVHWFFPGGSPAFSSQLNPNILYESPGSYPVTMIVFVAGISDTVGQNILVEILENECTSPQIFTQINGLEVTAWTDCPGSPGFLWGMGDGSTFATQGITYQYDTTGTYDISLTVTGQCGGTATATTQVSITGPSATGGQVPPVGPFTVHPNPANGQVFFSSLSPVAGEVGIRLLTATGTPIAALKKGQWGDTAAMPLGQLPAGLYFYEIQVDGQGVQQGKLVVVR